MVLFQRAEKSAPPAMALAWGDFLHPAHVGDKYVRNPYGTVFLLVVFEDCRQRTANGHPGTVKGMQVFWFFPGCGTETDPGPARLEILTVRTGRNLPVAPAAGEPDLQVVAFGRGKPHIPGGKQDHAVRK